MTKNEDLKACLIVDAGRREPVRIYPYEDGNTLSLNIAVQSALFEGDVSIMQGQEVAGITGDLLHDGDFHGEDFTMTLRTCWINTRPTVTLTTAMEDTEVDWDRLYFIMKTAYKVPDAKIGDMLEQWLYSNDPRKACDSKPTTSTSYTTDGDAERALEDLRRITGEGKDGTDDPRHDNDTARILYVQNHERTIEAALQSTRKPPVMLQDAADWIRLLLPLARGYVHANPGIRSTECIIEDAENALATLDAVLAEGNPFENLTTENELTENDQLMEGHGSI